MQKFWGNAVIEENPGSRKPGSEDVWVERAFVCLGVLRATAKICATPDRGCPITHERKNETMLPLPSQLERKKDKSTTLILKRKLCTLLCALVSFSDCSCSEAAPWWQQLWILLISISLQRRKCTGKCSSTAEDLFTL